VAFMACAILPAFWDGPDMGLPPMGGAAPPVGGAAPPARDGGADAPTGGGLPPPAGGVWPDVKVPDTTFSAGACASFSGNGPWSFS
jgi:hypothetical protein